MGATCCNTEDCLKNEKNGVTEITGRPSPKNDKSDNYGSRRNMFKADPNVSVLSMSDVRSDGGVNTNS